MQKRKTSTPIALMIVSICLLTILQALWLKTEYSSALDAFGRETNMTFRGTMHQLSDSLFFSSMQQISSIDSTANLQSVQLQRPSPTVNNIKQIVITNIETSENDSIQDESQTAAERAKEISIMINNEKNPEDTIIFSRTLTSSPQDMRWMFTGDMKGYSTDTIAMLYRRNLSTAINNLSFVVLEKDFPTDGPRHFSRSRIDSLPFQTSFYPFARKLYAIEFQNAQWHIYKKLTPQAGFALFTTGLIFLSFLLVYRSMRAQQKLMEQKDNFVGNITHELKTPVATVGVVLEAIKNFEVLKDKQKTMEYLDLASKELNRLSILTDKILKTSVLDYSEEIAGNQSDIDLETIIKNVLDSFQVLAQENQILLHFTSQGQQVIRGNEEHLTQAIYNLVDNAFKHGAEGKEITLTLKGQNEYAIIEVMDKGPGIAPEYRKKIFDKFYRVPTGNIHNVKGYGLGLHYVAGVVRQHGGTISVDSTQGAGSRFIVKLKKG
jgi:two-component system, OmpR family, phosphate regulon sensor histidine kinase PhoR